MAKRTLAVISARFEEAGAHVAAGCWPRKDFVELVRRLDADVIDHATVERHRAWRTLRRVAGMPTTQAVIAFLRCNRYDAVFTDGEHIGIPLALLLRLARRRPRHVTIGHLLTTKSKRRVFRWLQPQRGLDAALLHATLQQRRAREALGLSEAQTPLVPYQVDPAFWRTSGPGEPEDMICSAGLEYRDYETMIAAVRDLPLRVVIAAGSRWSRHHSMAGDGALPPRVEVASLDYESLRDLYARARAVVVPLREVDNQAGITTVLEAMAMARPVIVTATRGQRDVVRGRLCSAAGPAGAPMGGPAAFGVTGLLARVETGLYVPPGDPRALRAAIQYLMEHPEEAARMGAAGRRLVEEQMSLDLFVRRVAALVKGAPDGEAAEAARGRRPLRPVLGQE